MLRIGYDQAAFEEAVQEVILAPKSRDEWEKAMRQKRREKAGLTQEEEEQQGEESQQTAETGTEIDDKVTTTTTSVPAPSLAPVNKEHLAFVVSTFPPSGESICCILHASGIPSGCASGRPGEIRLVRALRPR